MSVPGPRERGSNVAALGIDVGGTKVAAGIVEFPDGRVHLRRELRTRAELGGQMALDDVVQLAGELAAAAPALGLNITSVGLGICELVSTKGEIISANCLSWKTAEVRQRLSAIAPVVVEADVRAAAVAEALFGAGRRYRIFVYLTVGTGISSSLVVDGDPFTGARGATGTAASSPLPRLGLPWYKAETMTLEQIASGPALVARWKELGGQGQTGKEVLAAAKAGNSAALSVVHSAGEALGATVAWLVNVLDPEAVIIGGGLGLSEGPYWESLETSARKHIWSDLHRGLPIVRAETGLDAGVVGAAAAAWKRIGAP